jgi:ribosome-associated protein
MAPRNRTIEITTLAALAATEKLATNVVALDLTQQLLLSEVFLIVSGKNERQIEAISDEIELKLQQVGEKTARKEKSEHWILLDYDDLVVHIQTEEIRQYYMLDRLWNDCPVIDLNTREIHQEQR